MTRPISALAILLGVVVAVIVVFVRHGTLNFDKQVPLVAVITIAGFVVVIFQLWQGYIVQRAKFLTDYLTKIYTDEELNSAFHRLVETYTDKKFDEIDKIATDNNAKKRSEEENAPVFDIFEKLQGQRALEVGHGYYHPECFQGSEEEKRLDALIGYLDIVGYHYYYGIIRMRDLAALLNYHLATFASRKVIARYLEISGPDWWSTNPIRAGSGDAQLPYLYFRQMLEDFVTYNKKNRLNIQREQQRIAKKLKGQVL